MGGALQAGGHPFSRGGQGSREEGDRFDNLGEAEKFWKPRTQREIFFSLGGSGQTEEKMKGRRLFCGALRLLPLLRFFWRQLLDAHPS
jgi:hypothetical protein